MLSPETHERLKQAEADQDTYVGNAEVLAKMASKTNTLVVGGTKEGKSTVIRLINELDPSFGIAGSIVSREPRNEDTGKDYDYVEHTDEGLSLYFDLIDNHRLVQYIVHPTTKYLYGSLPYHYTKTYSVLDTLYGSVANFHRYGFGQTVVTSLVSDPKQWAKRFDNEFTLGCPERLVRLQEAHESRLWSLSQASDTHTWVENILGKPEVAARQIIDITQGDRPQDNRARQLAEDGLVVIEKMLAKTK